MKHILGIIVLAMLCSTAAWGQVPERFEKKQRKDTTTIERKSPDEVVDGDDAEQVEEEPDIWDKLVFGGNASVSFGTTTFILIAPSVGYKVSNNLVAGTGFIYQYLRWNQAYNARGQLVKLPKNDLYENQTYGPKFFANYFPFDQVFMGAQFEYLNHDLPIQDPNTLDWYEENRWSPVLWLEGGLKQNIGKKGFAVIGLRANVLHDYTSPYASWWQPVIGIYF